MFDGLVCYDLVNLMNKYSDWNVENTVKKNDVCSFVENFLFPMNYICSYIIGNLIVHSAVIQAFL